MSVFYSMAQKEIVLFRHAKKEFQSSDPDLSPEGVKQAQMIVQIVQKHKLPQPQHLISSPRRRAQQTLVHLQEEFQIPLIVDPALDERTTHETRLEFKTRINHFLFKDLPLKSFSCAFLCTHLDWIEMFAEISPLNVDISSDILHIPPAYYYHMSISHDDAKEWTLIQKGQIL